MKNMLFVLSLIFVLIFSFVAHANYFNGVYFDEAQNAYAVTGDGYWLKSIDGGMTWSGIRLPTQGPQNEIMNDVYMLDNQRGWVIGRLAQVFYTDNGGWDWERQTVGHGYWASRMDMFDENTGWVVCAQSAVISTKTGGVSSNPGENDGWICQWVPDYLHLTGVSAIDSSTCWISSGGQDYYPSDNFAYLFKTSGGGDNWDVAMEDSMYQLRDIDFTTPQMGYSVGGEDINYQGIIYKTNDSGQSWQREIFPDDVKMLRGLSFVGENFGWACGDSGTIIRTTDAWETYQVLNSGVDARLCDIDFADPLNGVVGGDGVLLVTSDGGQTWENRMEHIRYSPNPFKLYYPHYAGFVDWESLPVEFSWFTATDPDSDDPIAYNLYVSNSADYDSLLLYVENIPASDDSLTCYVAEDLVLEPYTEYYWKVVAFDSDGLHTWCRYPAGKFFTLDVSVDDENYTQIPDKPLIKQNYPNPFNPNTTMAFTIPPSGGNTKGVELKIYDLSGKLIKNLIDEPMEAGYHSVVWDGNDEVGNSVTSGIYLYRIKVGDYTETKQCIILK